MPGTRKGAHPGFTFLSTSHNPSIVQDIFDKGHQSRNSRESINLPINYLENTHQIPNSSLQGGKGGFISRYDKTGFVGIEPVMRNG